MDSKIRDKIKQMITSEDREIVMLGERMFWDHDPSYQDYCKTANGTDYLDPRVFYRLKAKGRVFVKEISRYIYRWNAVTDDQLRLVQTIKD